MPRSASAGAASLASSTSSSSSSSSESSVWASPRSIRPYDIPGPPDSPEDTFGGTTPELSSPLVRSSPAHRPVSYLTTPLTATGSRSFTPSPRIGGVPLPEEEAITLSSSPSALSQSATERTSTSRPLSERPLSDIASADSQPPIQHQPASASFGRAGAVAAAQGLPEPERPLSFLSRPFSPVDSEISYSVYSQRSSWVPTTNSPAASSANITLARKLRVSANPPLPDRPFLPPPPLPLSPRTLTSLVESSNSAASAAAIAASQAALEAGHATAGSSGAQPPFSTLLSASDSTTSLQPPSALGGAPQSPSSSQFSRHSRASLAASLARARAREREHSTDEPLPSPLGATSFASTTLPSMSPRATPTGSINRDLPPLPGELPLPHYSFLDEDPTLGGLDSPNSSLRIGGVAQFSGSAGTRRVSTASVPVSEPPRLKHISAQSGFSDLLPRPSSAQDNPVSEPDAPRRSASQNRGGWSLFAGGPAPAWGHRDSVRSTRSVGASLRSSKSKKWQSKRASLASSAHPRQSEADDDNWNADDDSVDLSILVRRAAVLERLLRAGKRASGIATNKRVSTLSTTTRYSGVTSKQSMSRHGHGGRRSGSRSRSNDSPRRTTSSSNSHSARRSAAGSMRHRIATKLGLAGPSRPFTGLGSDDGHSTDEPSEYSQDNFLDLASTDHSSSSHHLPPPGTPPRRAVSTSITRAPELDLDFGQGVGVIVFPELATMPPLQPIDRDGEVCAQSCLPASVAIPYTPLTPPPPTQQMHTSRSLHSLRNLRFVDEKGHLSFGQWSNGSAPTRTSRMSRSSTMLIGDVPSCDPDRRLNASARRIKIALIITAVLGIAIIIGLLTGLLIHHENSRRELR